MKQDGGNGFTLLELIIVMTIIGILAGMVVPSFREAYKNLKLITSAQRIASLITYARQKAVLERVNLRLNIAYDRKKYWLSVEKDPILYPGYYTDIKDTISGPHYLSEGVTINSYFTYITFYTDGKVDNDSLIVQDEDGDEYVLYLKRGITQVKITKKG